MEAGATTTAVRNTCTHASACPSSGLCGWSAALVGDIEFRRVVCRLRYLATACVYVWTCVHCHHLGPRARVCLGVCVRVCVTGGDEDDEDDRLIMVECGKRQGRWERFETYKEQQDAEQERGGSFLHIERCEFLHGATVRQAITGKDTMPLRTLQG